MNNYFEGFSDIFAFKDVLFIEKQYTDKPLCSINRDNKVFTGILVVFRDSRLLEDFDSQWENAVFISIDDSEAERFIKDWKAYITLKEKE